MDLNHGESECNSMTILVSSFVQKDISIVCCEYGCVLVLMLLIVVFLIKMSCENSKWNDIPIFLCPFKRFSNECL